MATPLGLFAKGIGRPVGWIGKALGSSLGGHMTMGATVGGAVGFGEGTGMTDRIIGSFKGAALGAIGAGALSGAIRYGGGIARTGYKGGKKLWSANMAIGGEATRNQARMMEFGSTAVSGPITRDVARDTSSAINRFAMSPAGRTMRGVGRVGMFAANHPIGVLGTVGGVYAGASMYDTVTPHQSFTSPTMEGAAMNINYNQQAIMAAEMGSIGSGIVGGADQMLPQFEYANWMSSVGSAAMRGTTAGRFASSTFGLNQGLHAGRHS